MVAGRAEAGEIRPVRDACARVGAAGRLGRLAIGLCLRLTFRRCSGCLGLLPGLFGRGSAGSFGRLLLLTLGFHSLFFMTRRSCLLRLAGNLLVSLRHSRTH